MVVVAAAADSGAIRAMLVNVLENSFDISLEGRLYFSLAGKHPLELSIEGTFSQESVRERSRGESTMVISSFTEGEYSHTVTIGTADSE